MFLHILVALKELDVNVNVVTLKFKVIVLYLYSHLQAVIDYSAVMNHVHEVINPFIINSTLVKIKELCDGCDLRENVSRVVRENGKKKERGVLQKFR